MKVDSHQVPKEYFGYLLGKANLKVNAVKDTPHKSQPSCNSSTRKISYKIFDPDFFFDALEESHVALRTVPTIVIAHTFCASPDTRISYRRCLLIQRYYCAV